MTTIAILLGTALDAAIAAAILGACLLVGLRVLPRSWLRDQGWHDLPIALATGPRQTATILRLREHLHHLETVDGVDLWRVPHGAQKHWTGPDPGRYTEGYEGSDSPG